MTYFDGKSDDRRMTNDKHSKSEDQDLRSGQYSCEL